MPPHPSKEHSVDQLIQTISEKAGISVEQAKTAVNGVLDFISDKLPEPIANQVKSIVEGGGDVAGGLMDKVSGGLGGMFGGKDE